MALFSATFGTAITSFNVHAVKAGDAAEMTSRLIAEMTAASLAGEGGIVDFNLAGAGSGPLWQGWFVTAATTAAGVIAVDPDPDETTFVAAVAGNPVEAVLRLKQRMAALTPTTVYKIEVAGAGDGPTYMAVALIGLPVL